MGKTDVFSQRLTQGTLSFSISVHTDLTSNCQYGSVYSRALSIASRV